MDSVSFDFEPWDLAEYLTPLVGLLLLAEWFRWVWRGRGAGRIWRIAAGAAALVVIAVAFAVRYRGTSAASSGQPGAASAFGATWSVAAIGVFALLWAVRSYRSTTRPLDPRERRLFLSLRCAAVVAVLLVLARPVLRWTRFVEDRGAIAMLLDDSRSMTIRDVAGGPGPARSRVEQVRQLLRDNDLTIERIRRSKDLHTFLFDSALREDRPEHVAGAGQATALAAAVQEASRRLAADNRRLVGVLVLSDGRENFSAADPLAVADELAEAGIAIWAVGLGSELPAGRTRGLTAQRLVAPPRVSMLNRLDVRGEVLALGLAGRPVAVELLFDDGAVATTILTPTGPREVLQANLAFTPQVAGLHKLTMKATAGDLEPDRRTVTMSQFIHVAKDHIQVLYVDRPRYERAAIARSLEAAREIRLMKAQVGKYRGVVMNRLPRRLEEWLSYDVFFLGDAPEGAVSTSELETLRDLVIEHGRGLLVLPVEGGLVGGTSVRAALAKVLPMATAPRIAEPKEFPITPTKIGLLHPICRFAGTPDGTKKLWSLLPPVPPVVLFRDPKPAALVLLATPAEQPVLLVQEAGRGRSAALALDSTWRWPLEAEPGRDVHARFWRQLVLWLANRRPAVWVTTNQPRYQLARLAAKTESVIVEAGIELAAADDSPRAVTLTGEIAGPGGLRQPLAFVPRGKRYEARPTLERDGEYRVEVTAMIDGAPAEPARAAITVESPDIELQEPTADFELLRQMAARTEAAGGAFATAQHAGGLLERILAGEHTTRRPVTSVTNLTERSKWPLFLIIAALLIAEWVMRKRRGLA